MLQILAILLQILQVHALINDTSSNFFTYQNTTVSPVSSYFSNGTATTVSKEQISTYSAQLFEAISYSVDLPYSVLDVVFAPGIVSSQAVTGGSSASRSTTASFQAITSSDESQLTISTNAIESTAIASASSVAASQASIISDSAISVAVSNAATSNIVTVHVSAPVVAASSLVQSASANPVVYLSASAATAEPLSTFYNTKVATITNFHYTTFKERSSVGFFSNTSSSILTSNSTFASGTGVGTTSSTLSSIIGSQETANTALPANTALSASATNTSASVVTKGLVFTTPIVNAKSFVSNESLLGTSMFGSNQYEPSSSTTVSLVNSVVIKNVNGISLSSNTTVSTDLIAKYVNTTSVAPSASSDTALGTASSTATAADAVATQKVKRDNTQNAHPQKLIQTHKFYTNMLLEGQNNTIFTYPYNIFYSTSAINDPNNQIFAQGLGISIDNGTSRIFTSSDSSVVKNSGDYQTNVGSAPITYSNPTMVAGIILSASEFRSHSLAGTLSVDDQKIMSAKATLALQQGARDNIEFPLFEGQGMVSSIYHGSLTPLFSTTSYFSNVQQQNSSISGSMKYIFEVSGTSKWVVYITFPDGSTSSNFTLTLSKDLRFVTANMAIDGLVVQTAILTDELSSVYDKHAGTYVTDVSLNGATSSGSVFEYSFDYKTNSNKTDILVYLMPHHLASIDSSISKYNTNVKVDSPVNGQLTGFNTNKIVFSEQFSSNGDVPTFMPFKNNSTTSSYSSSDVELLKTIIAEELTFVGSNFTVLTANTDTYTAGKVFAKYAQMLLIAHEVIGDEELTKSIFDPLVEAMAVYLNNEQAYPFYYIEDIGGVSVVGKSDLNYGATYYNDHHFHYGYFINAAAIMGKVSKEIKSDWLNDKVKNWVNLLIMDVANPNEDDLYFPQYRMFDWYHGHSFALGLFASGDGRNQESSSEDVNFVYGMKLWADVIEDESLLADANLMLLVMKRSLNTYYFFDSSSEVIPACYTPHMVPGILFENKLSYVTFFGTDMKYIHGIQMLPITPASILIREKSFVESEWTKFSMDLASAEDDPWSHILKLNQALFNGGASVEHFSKAGFSLSQLDDGQSLTWSLAFSMAMK